MTPLRRSFPQLVRGSLASLALAAPAWSAAAPVEAELAPLAFASLESAVAAAAAGVHERSVREDREHLGGVFGAQDGRSFVYSAAVGRRGADHLSVRLRAPAGFRLVAIWHTHGAPGRGRSLFSARDTELARSLRLPIYLATPSGALRVFHPGDAILSPAQARRRDGGWQSGFARGAAVPAARADATAVAARSGEAGAECEPAS
jgi:hypothetical protein